MHLFILIPEMFPVQMLPFHSGVILSMKKIAHYTEKQNISSFKETETTVRENFSTPKSATSDP